MTSFRTLRLTSLAAALALASPLGLATSPQSVAKAASAVTPLNATNDRFIVTYHDGSNEKSDRNAALQNIRAAVSRAGLDRVTRSSTGVAIAPTLVNYQRKLAIGSDLIRTSRKLTQAEANAFMMQLAADPAVVHVEPDLRMRAVRDARAPSLNSPLTFTPDDPYYATNQWHFSNPAGGANVNNAWDLADGSGVVVAVLDTGITQHPDMDLSLADAGYDFITNSLVSGRQADGRVPGAWDTGDWTTEEPWLSACTDDENPPENSSWHGTHVSGTVAELTNNGLGMAGVAYKARVLPVRVLGHCGGDTSDISDAIVWASGGHVDGVPDNANPAQVINMSLGGPGVCTGSDVTGRAIADAISRGTTVVVAAGNSNADAANFSPASCPGVITVGSNGITGKRAFYSNYGAGVTIAAPGGGIFPDDGTVGTPANPGGFVWSASNLGTTVPDRAAYAGQAGTSQASPHVAGTVALILSATKEAGLDAPTPEAIKSLLTSTARRFPVAVDRPIGAGIVDAHAAVDKALGNGGGDEEAIPLSRGAILGGQSGGTGTTLLYSIEVPAGARALNLRSFGGSGDVSFFVNAGAAPSADGGDAQFRSVKPGNSEAVVIASPQATTYYIRVVGAQAFENVSVLASYTL